ncbi:MAG: RES family NAD+ phosphorylase [Nitrospinae bacterium]|nr:RES family NAD+ phosphorylase [Nitrospinota bacterium]
MIVYRHAPSDRSFFWEDNHQPPARWHGNDEGPVQYCADTPDGAWAEFLRHEEITGIDELMEINRAIWAIEIPDTEQFATTELIPAILLGGKDTYEYCRQQARKIRETGAKGMEAPSVALLPGFARGMKTDDGLKNGEDRNGKVMVIFGKRNDLVGWIAAIGRPDTSILSKVRHFSMM